MDYNFYWRPNKAQLDAITGLVEGDRGLVFGISAPATFYAYHSDAWVELEVAGTGAGLGANTFAGKQTMMTPSAGPAGFRLPHGSVPTNPVNGDVWTTTEGIFAQISGVVIGPLGTGGGGGGAWGSITGTLSDQIDLRIPLTKTAVIPVVPFDAPLGAGNGQAVFTVPAELDGANLVSVGAHVYTASSSGLPTFRVQRKKISNDALAYMTSTPITIDVSERDSSTAATPPVIDAANDDVHAGDEIWIDVTVSGTGTKGGEVRLGFRKP
ncbi:MAG: hypothetical protein WAW37_14135 [Syntrophobacteraceae bacterium]